MKCSLQPQANRLVSLLLVVLPAFTTISRAAVNPVDLEALKQLFDAKQRFAKDPATAFGRS